MQCKRLPVFWDGRKPRPCRKSNIKAVFAHARRFAKHVISLVRYGGGSGKRATKQTSTCTGNFIKFIENVLSNGTLLCMVPIAKTCLKHGEQPIEDFYFEKWPKKRWRCRKCIREKKKRWQLNNPEKHKAALKRHREKYPERRKAHNNRYRKNKISEKTRREGNWKFNGVNLTFEKYQELILIQTGRCAICLCEFIKTPAVDHDHETGIVRGLLCSRCNVGLGIFNDSAIILASAIKYLDSKMETAIIQP